MSEMRQNPLDLSAREVSNDEQIATLLDHVAKLKELDHSGSVQEARCPRCKTVIRLVIQLDEKRDA